MADSAEKSASWDDIERSESYLVSGMFEEASALSSSIIHELIENYGGNEVDDMLESTGMVLVQSLSQHGRTLDILKELKMLFGTLAAVPVLVFVTGACLQISEAPSSGADKYLEEFLSKWTYNGDGYYSETENVNGEGLGRRLSLDASEYLEVVDLYLITCLGKVMRKIDLAISWIDKSALPEEKRQELLRQLNSMNASNTGSSPTSHVDKHGKEFSIQTSKDLELEYKENKQNSVNETVLRLSRQRAPRFWWFRNITLKFGNKRVVVSNGKVFVGCILLLMGYLLRKKRDSFQRAVRKQAQSMKKALVDLWQLAFSYQVNPLAAVQPLPAAGPHRNR